MCALKYFLAEYISKQFVIINFLYFFSALTDGPRFIEPIPNVTVALGRDASLPCVVDNLGTYKVIITSVSIQLHTSSLYIYINKR